MADLGAGAHNLVRFNRWGRFLAVAGFGNLPGDLVVWENKDGAKWKQLAATRHAPDYPTPPPSNSTSLLLPPQRLGSKAFKVHAIWVQAPSIDRTKHGRAWSAL